MSKDYESQALMGSPQPPFNPAGGPPPPQQQYYPPPPQQQAPPYYQQPPPPGYAPFPQQSPSGAPIFINNNVAPAAAPSSPTVIYAGGQGGCANGNHQMVERTKPMGYVWCILCFWNPICWVCLCRKKHVCRQCGYSPDAGPCGS